MSKKAQADTSTELFVRGKSISFWIEKFNLDFIGTELSPREIENLIVDAQVEYYTNLGVILKDHSNFYFEGLPDIGSGCEIFHGVFIDEQSVVGRDVKIYPNCFIENSTIGDSSTILPGSVIRGSLLKNSIQLGPYTHLRNGVTIEEGAKVGNFVEMKKSTFGKGSKAMHLSYIGDAKVGESVNIGAGTITCNYDGVNKNTTIIEDGVFVGSGTELIAPIKINKESYIAAGSTINEDVPEGSLAIARQKQRIIPGWSKRKKKKKSD